MLKNFLELETKKQERIINAALKEFAKQGYKDASTNEIVKEAGISKGLLYHYFENKKELFLFLYDYATKIFFEEFLDLINLKERDVLARLRQHTLLKFDLIHQYPGLFHFIIMANQKQPEEIQEEMDSKNRNISTAGYGKLFENIDESMFKDNIDKEKALNVIKWAMEEFANAWQQKITASDMNDMDYEGMLSELDAYFELFRKCFYK